MAQTSALVMKPIVIALALLFGLAWALRGPLHRYVQHKLAEAHYEHARWIAICLEFTKAGCDAEARYAADQVVILRREINQYRRVLAWVERHRREVEQ